MSALGKLSALALIVSTGLLPAEVAAQKWRTVQRSAATGGAEWLNVDLGYAAGAVTFGPGDAGNLYRFTLRYDEESFGPAVEFDRAGSSLGLSVVRVKDGGGWDASDPGSLDLRVAPDIPLRIALELGAAKAQLEFGGLSIDALEVTVGAAEVEMRFSSPLARSPETAHFIAGAADLQVFGLGNLGSTTLAVETGVGRTLLDFGETLSTDVLLDLTMGLGELEMRVPSDVGIDVQRTGLLLQLEAPGLQRQGDRWQSEGFADADRKLTVQLDGAIGRIKIVRVPTEAD